MDSAACTPFVYEGLWALLSWSDDYIRHTSKIEGLGTLTTQKFVKAFCCFKTKKQLTAILVQYFGHFEQYLYKMEFLRNCIARHDLFAAKATLFDYFYEIHMQL